MINEEQIESLEENQRYFGLYTRTGGKVHNAKIVRNTPQTVLIHDRNKDTFHRYKKTSIRFITPFS